MELVTANMEHNNSKEFAPNMPTDIVPLANHWSITEIEGTFNLWNGDSLLCGGMATYDEAMLYVRRNAKTGDTLRIEVTLTMEY